MRYSKIESERTSDKSGEIVQDAGFEFVEEEEEVTDKIPIEKFCQINNAPLIFDDPAAIVRVILLRAKLDYINYFGSNIYSVFVRTENNEAWFGVPVKNPNVGLMRWEKDRWDKVYGFSISMAMNEDP
jgi:hypothetical protein